MLRKADGHIECRRVSFFMHTSGAHDTRAQIKKFVTAENNLPLQDIDPEALGTCTCLIFWSFSISEEQAIVLSDV